MNPPWAGWALHAESLAGAGALGVLTAYTARGLIGELAAADTGARWRRLVSASLAVACGALAALLILLSGQRLPADAAPDSAQLVGALGLLAATTLVALLVGGTPTRSIARSAGAALLFGGGVCAALALAVGALVDAAATRWSTPGLAAAWLIASAGAAGAQALAGQSRPGSRLGRHGTLCAALVLGAALFAAEAIVLMAARPSAASAGATGLPAGAEGLLLLAAVGVPVLLLLLLMSARLEDGFRAMLARAREELHRASYTDPLTRLPNRQLFEERLQRAVHQADRAAQRLALLFVNLDGLKGVNEAYGQAAGDAVLRVVGRRLREFSPHALLARAGGDEFLLLLDDDPDEDAVQSRAAALLDVIARPCTVESRDVQVTGSIGIALYPEHGALSRLVPHAAAALNAAKLMGGATYCFFAAHMVAGRRDEAELLRDLRSAIDRRELELVYQPKIHAPSGQITGAEALMRWHHPRRGVVSPVVFIPLAEHYGLINALGNWAIDEACGQIRAWRNQGLRMRVAINLSVHQLRQPDLAARIGAALRRHRLEPRVLTCEVTESIAMDDSPAAVEVIRQLAEIGVHLAIDDFGTGYSNFSSLSKLPLEEIKIDRSLVLALEEKGAKPRRIVDAVVKFAQAMELKIVAEGVETERQQEILRGLGCDELQGFLFAMPMSALALARWAMNQEGPRELDFRASLFGETRAVELA